MFNLFKKKSIPDLEPKAFKQKLTEEENAVLLDVRTPSEFASGHIPNAVNINLQSLSFKKQLKDLDPSVAYLVYCKSGRRSMMACRIMDSAGFDKTFNLKGGILKWQQTVGQ